MPLKPNAKSCVIKEQIVEDLASGLTIQFEVVADGTTRLRLYGDSLPFGNRDIVFDGNGEEAGAGTCLAGLCRPAWLTSISEL